MPDKDEFQPREFHLKDLINHNEWQRVQDNFSSVTQVSLRTLDADGKSFTNTSNLPRLCGELIRSSSIRERICGDCLPTFLGGNGIVDPNLSYHCFSGLHNFITPLRINGGSVIGYIILGPVVLVMRKPKEAYRGAAEELGIDLDEFWKAFLEIRTISYNGMRSLVELVQGVAEYALKIAYQKFNKSDNLFPEESLRLNRLLEVLLDVAFQFSGADIGSIMFCERDAPDLTIRSSRGIPEDIVRDTRIRLGEGISGIAAGEKRALLVDNQSCENRIRPYLKRPYIDSAMVVPIMVQDRVVGVLNLGARKESSLKFNQENLQMMQRLVSLASLAIAPSG